MLCHVTTISFVRYEANARVFVCHRSFYSDGRRGGGGGLICASKKNTVLPNYYRHNPCVINFFKASKQKIPYI